MQMIGTSSPQPDPSPRPGQGLSKVALVLGIVSIPSSVLFGLGLLPGFFAIVLGGRVSARGTAGRGLALAGMSTGFIGTVASVLVILVVFQGIILPRLSTGAARASVGQAIPFALTSLSGNPVDSEALRGKRVVVDVWATWCGPCVATIPALDRLQAEEDVVVLGITLEDPTHVQRWVTQRRQQGKGPTYPIIAQGRTGVPAAFSSVQALPTLFILDGSGVVHDVQVGAHGYQALRSAVLAAPLDSSTRVRETTSP